MHRSRGDRTQSFLRCSGVLRAYWNNRPMNMVYRVPGIVFVIGPTTNHSIRNICPVVLQRIDRTKVPRLSLSFQFSEWCPYPGVVKAASRGAHTKHKDITGKKVSWLKNLILFRCVADVPGLDQLSWWSYWYNSYEARYSWFQHFCTWSSFISQLIAGKVRIFPFLCQASDAKSAINCFRCQREEPVFPDRHFWWWRRTRENW